MIPALTVLVVAAVSFYIGYKVGAHDALEASTIVINSESFDLPLEKEEFRLGD